jgi:hypothetical protein
MELPFTERFDIAINSMGWPAESFLMQFHESGMNKLAAERNKHGRTAFHWVAAHFGEWHRRSGEHDASTGYGLYSRQRATTYEKLASRLIRAGADLHALYHDGGKNRPDTRALTGIDPFFSFLAGLQSEIGDIWYPWSISHAISRWGEMLVAGGAHLEDYTTAENKFLGFVQCVDLDAHISHSDGKWHCFPVKLHISADSTLAANLVDVPRVPIWKNKAASVPGAWPVALATLDTIIWAPDRTEVQDGFVWNETGVVNLDLNRIKALAPVPPDHFYIDWAHSFVGRFQGTQDDHGPVASISRRDWSSRHDRDRKPGHSRASSTPPLIRTLNDGPFPIDEDKPTFVRSLLDVYFVHKCQLDLRWHACVWSTRLWRRCMQGRCYEPQHPNFDRQSADFENWFLRSDEHAHAAKRFADRFFPEQVHIVEKVLERARDRATIKQTSQL